jgi:FMN phosphatase YigB (HAD superfamily)
LELVKLDPEECVMVAAHAYNLRGVKALGMKTVYVHWWTDNVLEDQGAVRGENDAYLDDMRGLDDAVAEL